MGNNAFHTVQESAALRWRLLMGAVFLVGLGLRVWNAWVMQYSTNPDFGIAALMSKHIAEGRDFPVFFYGQAYMGSLEPAIGALFCRLLGASGFAVNLGTTLVGFLTLPLVYVWAKAAGGRRAGLAAVLFCMVGSDTIFHYGVAPRGGYMTLMACGLLTLWLSLGIALRTVRQEPVPGWRYAGLGLAAGLGWWSNQMIVVFFVAAAVVLLLGFRRSLWRGVLPAGIAFLIGSLPWWVWNVFHDWATFEFARSLGRVHYLEGIEGFVRQSLNLVELAPWNSGWDAVRLLLLLGMVGLFLVRWISGRWKEKDLSQFLAGAAAVTVVLTMAAVYVTSKYATIPVTRYLLPMYPALAVMLGVGMETLLQRFRWPVGWMALAVLIPSHLYTLPQMPAALREGRRSWEAAQQLAQVVAPLCDGVCFSGFNRYWVNFATAEKLCVSSQPKEPFAPYGRRAELAENPAVLDDFHGISDFLRLTQASGQMKDLRYAMVMHHLAPPSNDWRYVESTAITAARDAEGNECREALTDARMSTAWTTTGTNASLLTIVFDRPRELTGLRLLSPNERYPVRLTVELGGLTDAWQPVCSAQETTTFFWSGPRLMVGGLQFFQEFRFAAPSGGVSRLRLTVQPLPRTPEVRIGELLFLEAAPGTADRFPSVEECVAALERHQVKILHAPRWLAGRISQTAAACRVEPLPSVFSQSAQDWTRRDSSAPYPIVFREPTGLMVEPQDASRTRALLEELHLSFKEESLQRYQLLVVQPGSTESNSMSLCWTELGCFAAPAMAPPR